MSIRLFVADTDEAHIQRISRTVARCADIDLVGSGGNGTHVLRQLSIARADMLITELQLPGLDGIMLLRDLQKQQNRPSAIVCTHFYSPVCVSSAWAHGAAYFLYKPLDYNRLPEVIRDCHRARLSGATDLRDAEKTRARDPVRIVRALLVEIGMPAKLTGSVMLSDALLAACEDPSLLKNLSKGLYAEIAARMDSTPARMERALRNAIRAACSRSGLDKRFGHIPSNRELLTYLTDQLALRLAQ